MTKLGRKTQKKAISTPTFYPINVSELCLADYQRNIIQRKVKAYAAAYNPDIFGIILVNHRDGKYYIIDGQHRVETAKLLGIESVWCQVLEGLTYTEEAARFYEINNSRTSLNSNQKFFAKVQSQNPDALQIVKALSRYRFGYTKSGSTARNNTIGAVGAISKIYETKGYDGLCEILEILRKAWNGDHTSLRAEIIKGLNTFISNYSYDKSFLIKVLEKNTPTSISNRARVYVLNSLRVDCGVCFHVAKAIRDLYEEEAVKAKDYVVKPYCKIERS